MSLGVPILKHFRVTSVKTRNDIGESNCSILAWIKTCDPSEYKLYCLLYTDQGNLSTSA